MPTTISGTTGVSQIQDGTVATADIADDAITNAKVDTVAATKLTGTIADARFPATLPAASGANLTALNATNLGSGTVPTARLGSGSASSSVFLSGAGTWIAAGSTSASDLTSGTLPMARLSGTLPALNGSALTNLPADATKLPLAGGTITGLVNHYIASSAGIYSQYTNTATGNAAGDGWLIGINGDEDFEIYGQESAENFKIYNNGAYRLIVDNNGNIGIGGQNSPSSFDAGARHLVIGDTGVAGAGMTFACSTNAIIYFADGTSGDEKYRGTITYNHPGDYMLFRTGGFTERMKIDSNGLLLLGGAPSNTSGRISMKTSNYHGICIDSDGSSQYIGSFNKNGQGTGSITTSSSNCSYNTSSDYRLKENIVDMTGAITRLKTLQPKRFNWIRDETNTVVDGFIAHEVTAVPESIHGVKDAMTTEILYTQDDVDQETLPAEKNIGDVKVASIIDPQQIDQSKLVPLLVGALQEAITRIETLENA